MKNLAEARRPGLADDDVRRRSASGGLRKAAILMALLGDEVASEIYKHLGPDDIRKLSLEVARLGEVAPEAALDVLQEYTRLAAKPTEHARRQLLLVEKTAAGDGNLWKRRSGENEHF